MNNDVDRSVGRWKVNSYYLHVKINIQELKKKKYYLHQHFFFYSHTSRSMPQKKKPF